MLSNTNLGLTHTLAEATVSLIDTLLPPQNYAERNAIETSTRLNIVVQNNGVVLRRTQCAVNTRIGMLFLHVLQEAAQYYIESRFKGFDALVRNYGCQITALEVSDLASLDPPARQSLIEEAVRVQNIVQPLLKRCEGNLTSSVAGDNEMGLTEYLRERLNIDVRITETMARLVRLRLLCIVNEVDSSDNPRTISTNLYKMVKGPKGLTELSNSIESIVFGVQAEESRKAVDYIRAKIEKLTPAIARRSALLSRLVSQTFAASTAVTNVARRTPIVSIPLSYNTEVVLRSISNVILIKNKLKEGGNAIQGARPINLYLRNPDTLLSSDEANALAGNTPLVVIEGKIRNEEKFISAIKSLGLLGIIQTNCMLEPSQYASGTSEAMDIALKEDSDVKKDLDDIVGRAKETLGLNPKEISDTIFKVDHLYCASLAEEKTA